MPHGTLSRRLLINFFACALSTFQASGSRFQVICTHHHQHRDDSIEPRTFRPAGRPENIVILDSSFNPPTRAHLRMAISAIRDLKRYDQYVQGLGRDNRRPSIRLLLLLSVNNADKSPKPAPFEHRLAMMWAFAKDVAKHLSDANQSTPSAGVDIDIGLTTHPYFHDKSASIATAEFYTPNDPMRSGDTQQVVLVGYDTLIRIFNPKYYGVVENGFKPESNATSVQFANDFTTPMRAALSPMFRRAKLRVTLRVDDEWGVEADQMQHVENLLSGKELVKIGGDESWADRIELVEGRGADEDVVSSTLARDAAGAQDWDRLERMITDEVKEWVEWEGLYASQ